ncbi:hypothetical protein FSP39_013513 [Pinctada imbricata]|uniref:CABIT domain-containing protein n=1 Tax=Pinctada imbricata TaxID=66713 RepID=A0AA88XZ94_PINIB|nr:hypothetical protein FSP39_013513 [Pinctada imbricata]
MTSRLSDILQTLKGPVVVKIVKGRLDFHGWRTFGEEQCLTLFPPSKQIMVLNSTSYENINEDKTHGHDADRVDNISFLCSKTSEKFNDRHCEGKIFHDISSILGDVPRYLRVEEDFFAFVEDGNMCKMQRVEVGQVLELFEIHYDHSTDNTELYENVRLDGGEILRCRCAELGVEIMLPNSSKVDLVAMSDHNSYTLMDIADRFSFPRSISFSDTALSTSMKKLRKRSELLVASETVEEMLFACELGKTNIEFFDEKLLQCDNVFMSPMSKTDTSNVWVEQCTGCVDSLDTFRCLYTRKKTTLDNGQMLYSVFGMEQNASASNIENDNEGEEEGDGEDYEPMNKIEIPECPPVRQFLRSFENSPASSQNSSRPASLQSVQSSRSSGSRSSAGEDHGGSYVHIHVDHYPTPMQDNSLSPSESSEMKVASSLNSQTNVNTSEPDDVSNPIAQTTVDAVVMDDASHPNTQAKLTIPDAEDASSPTTQARVAIPEAEEAWSPINVATITSPVTDQASSLVTQDRSTTENDVNEIQNMGVSELCQFLQSFKLNNFAKVCETEMVDGEFLSSLSDEELKSEPFNLKDFDLKKFTKLKSGWRPRM